MRKIAVSLKKCFCLILSTIMIMTNGQLFAQDGTEAAAKLLQQEMKEIHKSYKMVTTSLQTLEDVLKREAESYAMGSELTKDFYASLKYETPQEYETLIKLTNDRTKELLVALDDLSKRYEQYLATVPQEKALDNLAIKYIRNKIEVSNEAIRQLSLDLTPWHNKNLTLNEALTKVKELKKLHRSYKSVLFTDPETLIGELYGSSEELARGLQLEYALKADRTQEAVRISLKAGDEGTVTVANLAKDIRNHLSKFRKTAVRKLETSSLRNSILKVGLKSRPEYVEKLLGVTPEERVLIKDIRATENALGKKIINRIGGPLIVITAGIVALTVTGFTAGTAYAQNHIQERTNLYEKMKSGNADISEAVQFFEDEANTATIVNDEQLFADMVNLHAKTLAMDEDLDDIINLMAETDIQEDLGFQPEDASSLFLNSYKNFDLNRAIAPLGTI